MENQELTKQGREEQVAQKSDAPQNKAEYMRNYRARNKDKIHAYQQAYEEIHKVERRLQKKLADKTYREKNMEKIKEKNRTPLRRWQESKYSAHRRGLEFTLSFPYFCAEIAKSCHYCRNLLGKSSVTCCGLDRVDNTKGYIEGNVVSCCATCNKIKLDKFTEEETRIMVNALLSHRQMQRTEGPLKGEITNG